jgi:hypothetical protein
MREPFDAEYVMFRVSCPLNERDKNGRIALYKKYEGRGFKSRRDHCVLGMSGRIVNNHDLLLNFQIPQDL